MLEKEREKWLSLYWRSGTGRGPRALERADEELHPDSRTMLGGLFVLTGNISQAAHLHAPKLVG